MTTYIADLDVVGSEMERPFARIYVEGETPDEALAAARASCQQGERARDAVTPLQEVLDAVLARPSEWTISWKHEGRFGPVFLTDLAKAPQASPTEAVGVGIPFGSDPEWLVALPWSTRAEAKRLARYLGLTLQDS